MCARPRQEHWRYLWRGSLPTERPERPERPGRLAKATGLLMLLIIGETWTVEVAPLQVVAMGICVDTGMGVGTDADAGSEVDAEFRSILEYVFISNQCKYSGDTGGLRDTLPTLILWRLLANSEAFWASADALATLKHTSSALSGA
ncbi:hypothetical protein P167DRAFT_580807 [Morchella conica CCBAS932]|uniref:Uncharacterized protein n=1 Tax=Morchella conica CCBAS932 TaxID=1392247 RepID=A0A3N4KA98_9PEZI|nr:hypothetical protein P167DRAFT_580807 [Morchella conica CCBAS932]